MCNYNHNKIKAPYNFVPVNKEVFFPYWAEAISHDIPFTEGLSGCIELEITAKTPLFIGKNKENGSNKVLPVTDANGKYFIPGTSVKGMLRSVMEVLSFAKFGPVDNQKYGIRDFQNEDIYTLKGDSENICAGWLFRNPETNSKSPYFIKDTGKINEKKLKVEHKEITFTYNQKKNEFASFFSDKNKKVFSFNNRNKKVLKKEYKIAEQKYKLYYGEKPFTKKYNDEHYLVFTGQPAFNNKGKHHEFKFPVPAETQSKLEVSKEQWNDFKFLYFDHDPDSISKDWKFWKDLLKNGKTDKIPVFFRKDTNGNLIDFGLSMLYKMPYKHTVYELINEMQPVFNSPKPDLPQCIFGYTSKEHKLKGRVHISPAYATKELTPLSEVTKILASPKASYYPSYIKQPVNGNGNLITNDDDKSYVSYKTMNDSDAELSGRKRYPVRGKKMFDVNAGDPSPNQERVSTKFSALPSGSVFKTVLHYHNLLPKELGAIISSITFQGHSECFHSLGMAKPLGYGIVDIKINNLDENIIKNYIEFFQILMLNFEENWLNSPQLIELFSMANPKGQTNRNLEYMQLNEHAEIKKRTKENIPQALPLNSLFKNTQHGTVKFFNETNGFGFIIQNNTQKEYFVHVSGLLEKINEGDHVEFYITKNNKGFRAIYVKKVKNQ